MYGEDERFLWGKLRKTDQSGKLGAYGWVILKQIFKKCGEA